MMKKYVCFVLSVILSVSITYAYDAVADKEVRTAEFAVTEQCWGDCQATPENVMEEKVVGTITINTADYGINWRHTFKLDTYYSLKTVENSKSDYETAAGMLTDEGVNSFLNHVFVPQVIDQVPLQKKVNGEWVDIPGAKEKREALSQLFDNTINDIREQYRGIKILLPENGESKSFVHKDYLTDVETSVFSQDENDKLIKINTDKYNDVFC